MVRPKKWRLLSPFIKDYLFKPSGIPASLLKIADLKGDEIEAMLLCDREELEQDAAGRKMGISRPTVQRLLYSGRRKVADALVEGKAIQITFPKYVTKRR